MAQGQQFCTFYLDRLCFGVEVEKVQEIIRYKEMTDVPLTPPEIHGLINLRGEIVTAINLRRRLKLGDYDEDEVPMNVVVRTNNGVLSFLVDQIGDVLEVNEDDFEPPPDTVDAVIRSLIDGVYKLKGYLLLVLDTEKTSKIEMNYLEGQLN